MTEAYAALTLEERASLWGRGRYQSEPFLDWFELSGYRILSDQVVEGEHVVRVRVKPGVHQIGVQFRPYNSRERRWHYGNYPPERQDTPIVIDSDHPYVGRLVRTFRTMLEQRGWHYPYGDLVTLVATLNALVQSTLRSSPATEDKLSLSAIISSGESACAGKTLLAGVLLDQLLHGYTVWSVHEIIGYTTVAQNGRRMSPHGHVWMRIGNKGQTALYDPYYDYFCTYDMHEARIHPDDPFARYDVNAGFLAFIHRSVPGVAFGKVVVVENTVYGNLELSVTSDSAHLSQIVGERIGEIETTQGGELTFHNGCLALTFSPNATARMLYPLTWIQQIG